MARTVKTTGIALKAFLIFGVEDDGTVKILKSINSSSADNTTSVRGDMTVSGTLTYEDITWSGGSSGISKTLKTVRSNASSYVQFGTNKPWVPTSTTWANGMLGIYIGEAVTNGAPGFVTPETAGYRIPYLEYFTGPVVGWKGSSTLLGNGTTTLTAGNLVTTSVKHKASDTTNNLVYLGIHNAALANEGYTGNSDFAGVGDSNISRLLVDSASQYWEKKCSIYMLVGDDYASNAARLTALQGLHDDPYGTLFESAGGTVSITGVFSTSGQTVPSLNLSIGL